MPALPWLLHRHGIFPVSDTSTGCSGGKSVDFVDQELSLIPGKYKQLSSLERALACWFMVTGLIHFVTEGGLKVVYFLFNLMFVSLHSVD